METSDKEDFGSEANESCGGEKGGKRCGTEEERKFRKLFDSEMGRMDDDASKRAEKAAGGGRAGQREECEQRGVGVQDVRCIQDGKDSSVRITGCPPAADIHKPHWGRSFR